MLGCGIELGVEMKPRWAFLNLCALLLNTPAKVKQACVASHLLQGRPGCCCYSNPYHHPTVGLNSISLSFT